MSSRLKLVDCSIRVGEGDWRSSGAQPTLEFASPQFGLETEAGFLSKREDSTKVFYFVGRMVRSRARKEVSREEREW